MSASHPPASASTGVFSFKESIQQYLVPYYLTVAAVLGAITAMFAVVVFVMVLMVTNFNVLGWME